MTPKQIESLKYKDYPEGSGGKAIYDNCFLPFDQYLLKYYKDPKYEEWERWYPKYVSLAFDEKRHDDMIKNFGFVDKKYYDFDEQNKIYKQLYSDTRLSEDVKKFIGFLSGVGFFKKYNLTLKQWFEMKNWHNPYLAEEKEGKSINEILSYNYGINYLKILLTQMPFWKR